MIVMATYTFNALHPGVLLGPGETWKSAKAASIDSQSVTTVTENVVYTTEKDTKEEV